MAYVKKDGKDIVMFVDQEYVDQQPDVKGEETKEQPSEEGGQAAAFDPETGEINWDCPCLGGMAQGPCGEEFKAAFSCFVYSTAEPKGIDCVEKFRDMQDCFRRYPDVYANEIDDEEEEEEKEENNARADEPEASKTEEPKEETQTENSSSISVSSVLEPEEQSSSLSSWISSWF